MRAKFETEIEKLTNKLVDGNARPDQLDRMIETNQACYELLLWVDYLQAGMPDCSGKALLSGARASMLETVAYIGLSLGRAAILSMRTQIDLLLGFSYFFDHPREWEAVCCTGDGFKLKTDILKYHHDKPGFKKKLSMIEAHEKYSLNEVYRILSAHIHGQSPLTLPKAGCFDELLYTPSFCASLIELQQEVTRGISNFLLVVFLNDNTQSPEDVMARVKRSLTLKERQVVFFEN